MLKYESTLITFTEIPDEISLCINLTCCPCRCKECFEPWLRQDYGSILSFESIRQMRLKNPHISCICFMGGDNDHKSLYELCARIREELQLKTAVYSGLDSWDATLAEELDYYKVGSYQPACGPLNNPNTNQRLYKYIDNEWIDITNRFQKKKD
jgi:anaerobic ribonucleoside-triphosphate reductase activating protein